jgi:hypothetical protein
VTGSSGKRITEKKFWPNTYMQSAQSLTSLYVKKVYFSVLLSKRKDIAGVRISRAKPIPITP